MDLKALISDSGKSVCGVQDGHSPVPPSDGMQKQLNEDGIDGRFKRRKE